MKHLTFAISLALLLAACSDNDDPKPEVFSQLAEITDGAANSQKITYDDYGRVIRYEAAYPGEKVTSTYSYPSDDLMRIHTEDIVMLDPDVNRRVCNYDDEVVLEKGRIACCTGIFTAYASDGNGVGNLLVQKKYRHDFTYTADNRLNVVKCTEWNKLGDGWADDKPLTWEIYYLWDNGNLVEVRDCEGGTKPKYTYRYTYSAVSGIQNIVPVHYARHQYYPLQLKGYFGAQSDNLLIAAENILPGAAPYTTEYKYNISGNKITGYDELRNEVASTAYTVTWTPR